LLGQAYEFLMTFSRRVGGSDGWESELTRGEETVFNNAKIDIGLVANDKRRQTSCWDAHIANASLGAMVAAHSDRVGEQPDAGGADHHA
jgi:hypothetical protein